MRVSGRLLAVALFAALLISVVPSAGAAEPRTSRVIIVLAPYLSWSDITGGNMPVTAELAESGTVGNINIRGSARYSRTLSQTHVALTMSSGTPVAFDLGAPAAHELDQRLEVGTAGEAYLRSMGNDPGDAAIAYLGLARILRANTTGTTTVVPGALGQAIIDAGGSTAAVGNSDGGYNQGELYRSRPAAVLAMDSRGLVPFGDVSGRVLAEQPEAPYGLTTDLEAFEAAARLAFDQMDAHGGPGLLVLDPGDAERAFNFTADASPAAAEAHRAAAAATVDRVVALAADMLPEDGLLMIVSSAQPRPRIGPSGFGQVVLSGAGYDPGLVYSPSTHRAGLMTDMDVPATVLGALGIERPVNMFGSNTTSDAEGGDLASRSELLSELNATAVSVDTVRPSIQNTYILLTVIVLFACALLLRPMHLALDRWGARAASAFRHLILLLLSLPLASTLLYLVVRRPGSAAEVALLLFATTVVIWSAALLIERRWGSPQSLAFLGLTSALVLIADQLAGAPLSFSGLFSYSPLLGARYYGIGNEGAAIVVGAGLAGLAFLLDSTRSARFAGPLRMLSPLALGALVVVATAAPFFGANVGVVAWGTVAFGIMWLQITGKRFTWKSALLLLALVALALVAFSIYEVAAGAGGQTHLGRAWESARQGGVGELWQIVARKAETNWRVLRATNWSFLMLAILAFLGFMRWRPHGVFAETLRVYPSFAVAMTASLWASVVGYLTEDSGIVIPALMMLYITGSLLHVMLWRVAVDEAAA